MRGHRHPRGRALRCVWGRHACPPLWTPTVAPLTRSGASFAIYAGEAPEAPASAGPEPRVVEAEQSPHVIAARRPCAARPHPLRGTGRLWRLQQPWLKSSSCQRTKLARVRRPPASEQHVYPHKQGTDLRPTDKRARPEEAGRMNNQGSGGGTTDVRGASEKRQRGLPLGVKRSSAPLDNSWIR